MIVAHRQSVLNLFVRLPRLMSINAVGSTPITEIDS